MAVENPSGRNTKGPNCSLTVKNASFFCRRALFAINVSGMKGPTTRPINKQYNLYKFDYQNQNINKSNDSILI